VFLRSGWIIKVNSATQDNYGGWTYPNATTVGARLEIVSRSGVRPVGVDGLLTRSMRYTVISANEIEIGDVVMTQGDPNTYVVVACQKAYIAGVPIWYGELELRQTQAQSP